MPAMIDSLEAKKLAELFCKEVVENGLTVRAVGDKYHYCANTVGGYIRKYLDDQELLEKYKVVARHNRSGKPYKTKKTKNKLSVEELNIYYSECCESETPYDAIYAGQKITGAPWEVVEMEYKKWRERYIRQ